MHILPDLRNGKVAINVYHLFCHLLLCGFRGPFVRCQPRRVCAPHKEGAIRAGHCYWCRLTWEVISSEGMWEVNIVVLISPFILCPFQKCLREYIFCKALHSFQHVAQVSRKCGWRPLSSKHWAYGYFFALHLDGNKVLGCKSDLKRVA